MAGERSGVAVLYLPALRFPGLRAEIQRCLESHRAEIRRRYFSTGAGAESRTEAGTESRTNTEAGTESRTNTEAGNARGQDNTNPD